MDAPSSRNPYCVFVYNILYYTCILQYYYPFDLKNYITDWLTILSKH